MRPLKTETDDIFNSQRRSFAPLKIAGPWHRLIAQMIDLSVVALCTTWAMTFWFSDRLFTPHWWAALAILTIYVSLLTQIIFIAVYGNTLGKRLMNLKIQSARPKQAVTTAQIIQRTLSWWAGVFSFGTTWSTILSLNDRRGWHDLISETVVVHDNQNASHPTNAEKRVSMIWMSLCFIGFVVFLMLTLLYEFRALRSGQLTISDDAVKTHKERTSWYLLGGLTPPEQNAADFKSKDDQIVYELLKMFVRARDLPPSRRHEFYKTEFEAKESILCRLGQELATPCQTAQALAQMLIAENVKSLHPKALEGIRILEKSEAQNLLADQIEILEDEGRRQNSNSFERSILRAAQAHLMMKAGDFSGAKKVLASTAASAPEVLKGFVAENLCQAEALNDCHFQGASSCLKNPYWEAWSSGCASLKEPFHYNFSSEILGFWWSQAHADLAHVDDLSSWAKVKKRYSGSPAKTEATRFESYVISALDFVLNIKRSQPDDLVGKSKALGVENPLWGWAQSEALKEFGEQWTFLVHPAEKNLISRYNLLDKVNASVMTASRKKAQSVTEASSSTRNPNEQAAESVHHQPAVGARTQESR